MNQKKILIKNSGTSVVSQIISTVLQFVVRTVLLRCVGVEYLGISETFASVLNTLSITELGFQTAVVYNLYRPLNDKDYNKVGQVLAILKMVYRFIGIVFLVFGMVLTPFCHIFLKDITVPITEVKVLFLLQACNSAISYFLAYKRSLLFADQREYVSKLVDTGTNLFVTVVRVCILIFTKNYVLYIAVQLAQTLISNIVIHIYCDKKYANIVIKDYDKKLFREIFLNVKNIFVGKIAAYVYNSTDNIVISTFVSTLTVGYMNNYYIILKGIKTILASLLNPIQPIIGRMIARNDSKESNTDEAFYLYTYARYLIAFAVIVPLYNVIEGFISIWVGSEFIVSSILLVLLLIDLYIHLVHSACCDFLIGNGLFKYDKYIEIIGASTKIIISLIAVQFLGVQGVLLSTVLSQCVFWLSRAYVVNRYCIRDRKAFVHKYILTNMYYATLIIVTCILTHSILGAFLGRCTGFIDFIMKGCFIECISLLVLIIGLIPIKQHRIAIGYVRYFFSERKQT